MDILNRLGNAAGDAGDFIGNAAQTGGQGIDQLVQAIAQGLGMADRPRVGVYDDGVLPSPPGAPPGGGGGPEFMPPQSPEQGMYMEAVHRAQKLMPAGADESYFKMLVQDQLKRMQGGMQ